MQCYYDSTQSLRDHQMASLKRKNEVQLLYNAMLISSVQQSDATTHTRAYYTHSHRYSFQMLLYIKWYLLIHT